MKILVTGGAGYIGSVAVEQLILADESIVETAWNWHKQHPNGYVS